MDIVSVSEPTFWRGLLRAELLLTFNIVLGLGIGELILSLGLVERVFAPLIPRLARWGIHSKIAAAMMIALGSPRSGAALIAASYADGEISRDEATYGTLSLAFPGYLRRWVGTVTMATGIAGRAGLIYALVLISRSALRFAWVLGMLIRRGDRWVGGTAPKVSATLPSAGKRRRRLLKSMLRSLPWAWGFFALTYALIPFVERIFTEHVARWGWHAFLPPQGWAVAVSSLAHSTAALSSARGAIASADLGVGQAVLALLVGNMVGTITRVMRQNVGYWMGIFPRELVSNLVRWHLATMFTLELLSICIAWLITGVSVFG